MNFVLMNTSQFVTTKPCKTNRRDPMDPPHGPSFFITTAHRPVKKNKRKIDKLSRPTPHVPLLMFFPGARPWGGGLFYSYIIPGDKKNVGHDAKENGAEPMAPTAWHRRLPDCVMRVIDGKGANGGSALASLSPTPFRTSSSWTSRRARRASW